MPGLPRWAWPPPKLFAASLVCTLCKSLKRSLTQLKPVEARGARQSEEGALPSQEEARCCSWFTLGSSGVLC